VPIQWRKLARLALGRAAQTGSAAEKAVLLDMAQRYSELAEKTEGRSSSRGKGSAKDEE
jgi:hypothetical protein